MKYRIKIKNPIMGVPITFIDKFSSDQFEILGIDVDKNLIGSRTILNGKTQYARLLIRWLSNMMPNVDEDGVIMYASEKEN